MGGEDLRGDSLNPFTFHLNPGILESPLAIQLKEDGK